jgi:hypothetical protein
MEKFEWERKGQILDFTKLSDWGSTHAQVPYFIEISGKRKIYFTSRPPRNEDGSFVSYIHALDFEEHSGNFYVSKIYKTPILELGEKGCFDEFGTMPCTIILHPENKQVWMYYVGWSRKLSVPYDCAIGLAVSSDGGETFKKISNGPLIAGNKFSPFVLGCPRVYLFNSKWYMFYLGGIKWMNFNGKMECFYKLKLAISNNGLDWQLNDEFIIPEKYENECQTCASVFYLDGKYHMYFTYRYSIDFRNSERGYRIGYASSEDLMVWQRDDDKGNFSTSNLGWDSEMVCYPNVNSIDGRLIMFYCGNEFGVKGFGYAELKNIKK